MELMLLNSQADVVTTRLALLDDEGWCRLELNDCYNLTGFHVTSPMCFRIYDRPDNSCLNILCTSLHIHCSWCLVTMHLSLHDIVFYVMMFSRHLERMFGTSKVLALS